MRELVPWLRLLGPLLFLSALLLVVTVDAAEGETFSSSLSSSSRSGILRRGQGGYLQGGSKSSETDSSDARGKGENDNDDLHHHQNVAYERSFRELSQRLESFYQSEEHYRHHHHQHHRHRHNDSDEFSSSSLKYHHDQKARFLNHVNHQQQTRTNNNIIDNDQDINGTIQTGILTTKKRRRHRHRRYRILTIECQTTPLFLCPTCKDQLQQEQKDVLEQAYALYGSDHVKIMATTQNIFNGLVLKVPTRIPTVTTTTTATSTTTTTTAAATDDNENDKDTNDDSIGTTISHFERWAGVKRVGPHRLHHIGQATTTIVDDAITAIGAGPTETQRYCATGAGVTIGILDTGIDYTHAAFGGPGTLEAYTAAYGQNNTDLANTSRDGLFPTDKIIGGWDFIGDSLNGTDWGSDEDPIDGHGHGTMVASAILAVAPGAQLIAVKTCASALSGQCPEATILLGIEYLMDPNQDGSPEDKVDIINLSVGTAYSSPYYEPITVALENAFRLGVLSVASFGNGGNTPYQAGAVGAINNVLAVSASSHPTDLEDDNNNNTMTSYMEFYSSRGPGENNQLKPDMSAPTGTQMAVAASGNRYNSARGTSFSSPLATGAVALLKEKCPSCSPFALKALLMNTADRAIAYGPTRLNERAPATLMGSGNLRVGRALDAAFWAYSIEDVQPAISLGLVEASTDSILTRTIHVTRLLSPIEDEFDVLHLSYEFRDPLHDGASGAVTISFQDNTGNDVSAIPTSALACGASLQLTVTFSIQAAKSPPNYMTSGGPQGLDPALLDLNEFDGHIVLTASTTATSASMSTTDLDTARWQVILPFHMILRKAAKSQFYPFGATLPTFEGAVTQDFTITNTGAGVAQLDAYEILAWGTDQPEGLYGEENPLSDMRSVGYRRIPVQETGCDYLVEFVFTLWERKRHVGLTGFSAFIAHDTNFTSAVWLFVPAVPNSRECYTLNVMDEENLEAENIRCTGFPPDHGTNSANTVLRACSNDLNLTEATTPVFYAKFRTSAYPHGSETEQVSETIRVNFEPRLSAPSYDIGPGETLNEFTVTGNLDRFTTGLQVVTNAFRNDNSTGAATIQTESLYLVRQFDVATVLSTELTPDEPLELPVATELTGPQCNWTTVHCVNDSQLRNSPSRTSVVSQSKTSTMSLSNSTLGDVEGRDELTLAQDIITSAPACPPIVVPRLAVPTHEPTTSPSFQPTGPTSLPSLPPTFQPTAISTTPPSTGPTEEPLKPVSSGGMTRLIRPRPHPMFIILIGALSAASLTWL
jgi:hypothetical protein